MIGIYHGNKIDKQGHMIWPQLPTKLLQIMTGIGYATIQKNHL